MAVCQLNGVLMCYLLASILPVKREKTGLEADVGHAPVSHM